MALTKYKLGELLIRNTECNTDASLGIASVRGLLNTKEISSTKVNVSDRDLKKFLVVRPGGFVFNHRVHDKLGLGYNTFEEPYLFTNDYVAFYVKPELKDTVLSPDYLYIWFLRPEFDRYMLFKTYGSATLFFSWDNMCELEIRLPDISIQQKYVAVYKSMLANQQSYEHGLEDLKLTCDAYIENLGRRTLPEKIRRYLIPCDDRNEIGLSVDFVRGLSVSKQVITTKANMNGVSLSNYKLFPPKAIAYVSDTSRRGDKMSLGLNDSENTYLVSSISTVFKTDEEHLLPEYLMLFFCRDEFDRYARFHSWGSARETFDWDEMCNVEIPVPDIEIQQDIVNIFKAYNTRKEIAAKLKAQIQNICPILIKGSIEEGMKTNEA